MQSEADPKYTRLLGAFMSREDREEWVEYRKLLGAFMSAEDREEWVECARLARALAKMADQDQTRQAWEAVAKDHEERF